MMKWCANGIGMTEDRGGNTKRGALKLCIATFCYFRQTPRSVATHAEQLIFGDLDVERRGVSEVGMEGLVVQLDVERFGV